MKPIIKIEPKSLLGVSLGDPCPGESCRGQYDSVKVEWCYVLWQVSAVCDHCGESWVIDELTEEEPTECCFTGRTLKAERGKNITGSEIHKRWDDGIGRDTARTEMQKRSNFLLSMRRMMDAIGVLLRVDSHSRFELGKTTSAEMVAPRIFEEDMNQIFSGRSLASFATIGDHLDKCLKVIGTDKATDLVDMDLLKAVMVSCNWLAEVTVREMLRSWVNKVPLLTGKYSWTGSDLDLLHPYSIMSIKELSVLSLMMVKVLYESGIEVGITSDVNIVVSKAIEANRERSSSGEGLPE